MINPEKENGPVSKLGSSSGIVCGGETREIFDQYLTGLNPVDDNIIVRGGCDHLLLVAWQSLVLGQGGERPDDR